VAPQDVTTTVSSLMLVHIVDRLMALGYPEPEPRMLSRVVIHSRILCIIDTFHQVFFDRGSPVGSLRPRIELADFQHLDRLLFTTREHMTAAIGEMYNVLIDPADVVVRRGLAHMFIKRSKMGAMYLYRKREAGANVSALFNSAAMLQELVSSKELQERCLLDEQTDTYLLDGPAPERFSNAAQQDLEQRKRTLGKHLEVRLPPQVRDAQAFEAKQRARLASPSASDTEGSERGHGRRGPDVDYSHGHAGFGGASGAGRGNRQGLEGEDDRGSDYNYVRFGVRSASRYERSEYTCSCFFVVPFEASRIAC